MAEIMGVQKKTMMTAGNLNLFLWVLLAITVPAFNATTTYCDQSYLGRLASGVITSYNFPFYYRHNLTCTHRIYIPQYGLDTVSTICFKFKRFSLETSTPFCFFDHLKIHNTKYCGHGDWQFGSQPTESLSNVWQENFCWPVKGTTFDLVFNSDDSVSSSGFYATYQIHTNTQASGNSGTALEGHAPCAGGQWTCFNRKCIPQSDLCNNVDDCGDNSDETYIHARCGEENVISCDFADQGDLSDGNCGLTAERWFRTNTKLQYGPKGDHTNTTHGYYVYTDIDKNSVARLLSPEISLPGNKTYCLTFWYYMYGSPPEAKLDVFIRRSQAYNRPEWSRSKVAENQWLQGQVTFVSQSQLQMIFAAELENNFSGVALDDISIMQGPCLGDDISCNFESGFCGWTPTHEISHLSGLIRGDILWRRQKYTDHSVGPYYDNSSIDGSGYYGFVNYTSTRITTPHYRAVLVSPPVTQFRSGAKCLRFHYYLAGQDKDCCVVKVKLHLHDNSVTPDDIWSHHGDVRNAWKPAYITITKTMPYQIIIEGLVSHNKQGQIAIDTIVLDDGECKQKGGSSCEVGQYLCTNGKCIAGSQKCNGVSDCEDNSDEDWHADCPTTTTTTTTSTTPLTTSLDPRKCESDKFECVTTKECIKQEWICDSFDDCEDKSDESPELCPSKGMTPTPVGPVRCPGKHMCANGQCVPDNPARCDGIFDCDDRSDERNCTVVPPPCLAAEFTCRGSKLCMPQSQVCDGIKQCLDGSDEAPDYAKCAPSVAPSDLGVGPVIGISITILIVIIVIILVVFLFRRRKQKRHPPPRSETGISTISFNSDGTVNDRHHIAALSGMGDIIRNAPSYGSTHLNNSNRHSFHAVGGARMPNGYMLSEEAPPPYDSVLKDQQGQQNPQHLMMQHQNQNDQNNMIAEMQANNSFVPGVHRHTAVRNTLPGPGNHGGIHRNQSWRGGSSRHATEPIHNLQSFVSGLNPQPLHSNPHQQPHLVSPYAVRNYVPDPTANVSGNNTMRRDDFIPPANNRSGRRSLPRPPGIYPDGPHRTQGRPKLGTTALSSRRKGPRNYMNQSAASPHSESYDSDSTAPPNDHIYETLNLHSDSDRESYIDYGRNHRSIGRNNIPRDVSSHSVDALLSRTPNHGVGGQSNLSNNQSTSIVAGPTSPGGNNTMVTPSHSNGRMPYSSNGRNTLDYNNKSLNNNNKALNRSMEYNSPQDRRQSVGMPYNGSLNNANGNPQFIPMQFFNANPHLPQNNNSNSSTKNNTSIRNPDSSPPVMNSGPPSYGQQHSSSSESHPMGPPLVANGTGGCDPTAFTDSSSSGYRSAGSSTGNSNINSKQLLLPSNSTTKAKKQKQSSSSSSNGGKSRQQHPSSSSQLSTNSQQQQVPGGRDHERNDSSVSHGSCDREQVSTPDSQSHLLPSSNNSSFDQSQVGGLNGHGGGGRNDLNMSGVVFLPDMEETLLNPTSV